MTGLWSMLWPVLAWGVLVLGGLFVSFALGRESVRREAVHLRADNETLREDLQNANLSLEVARSERACFRRLRTDVRIYTDAIAENLRLLIEAEQASIETESDGGGRDWRVDNAALDAGTNMAMEDAKRAAMTERGDLREQGNAAQSDYEYVRGKVLEKFPHLTEDAFDALKYEQFWQYVTAATGLKIGQVVDRDKVEAFVAGQRKDAGAPDAAP